MTLKPRPTLELERCGLLPSAAPSMPKMRQAHGTASRRWKAIQRSPASAPVLPRISIARSSSGIVISSGFLSFAEISSGAMLSMSAWRLNLKSRPTSFVSFIS